MGPWASNAEKLRHADWAKWAKGLVAADQGHVIYSW